MLGDWALCPGLHWNETVPIWSLNVILAADLYFPDLAIVSTCEILVACDLLVKTRPFLGTSPVRISASLLGASKHLTLSLESWWRVWDLGRRPHLHLSYSTFCRYHPCFAPMPCGMLPVPKNHHARWWGSLVQMCTNAHKITQVLVFLSFYTCQGVLSPCRVLDTFIWSFVPVALFFSILCCTSYLEWLQCLENLKLEGTRVRRVSESSQGRVLLPF